MIRAARILRRPSQTHNRIVGGERDSNGPGDTKIIDVDLADTLTNRKVYYEEHTSAG